MMSWRDEFRKELAEEKQAYRDRLRTRSGEALERTLAYYRYRGDLLMREFCIDAINQELESRRAG